MDAHRIGVISDTHGLLRQEAAEILKSCEIILHAGDIGKPEILERLREITDTYAVLGNVDQNCAELFRTSIKGRSEKLPEELEIELFGFRIYMIHDKKQIRKNLSGIDIVIYGHSHKYEEAGQGSITWLNPGSCGPKRFRMPVTMMILTLYPALHRLETEKIDCLSISYERGLETFGEKSCSVRTDRVRSVMTSSSEEDVKIPEQDMYRVIREIMKGIDAGRKIADIAARNHIDERFAEQVCRMYVTHPGVDVDGILDRLERKNL